MKFFRWACRVIGHKWLRWSTGKSQSEYFDYQIGQEELLGFQENNAPMSMLLESIVKKCQSDGFRFITFDPHGEVDAPSVYFSKEFDHSGQVPIKPNIPISVPNKLLLPLVCHGLWRINHQDLAFGVVNRNLIGMRNHFESEPKNDKKLNCRCWLRNPDDCRSLVIQVLDSVTPT